MLDPWVPRLIAAWRRLRGGGGAAVGSAGATLTSEERRDIVAGAQRLSRGLTRDRELAGARYFEDPQLLGAYLFLYWPVSYGQAASVLRELGGAGGRVLDVGSGPGPLALAALDAGAAHALAIDRSAAALEVAGTLAGAAGTSLESARWEPGRPLPDGPFDLVLAGHVLNELYGDDLAARAKLVDAMMARLSAGGFVVLLEPALRETSRALLSLRDRLVAAGATVRAPCLYRGDCPALVRPSDWCHAERAWTPPPLVDELAHAAKLHRDTLKMSYLVLQAPGAPWPTLPDGRLFRIVSEPLPQKGKHRVFGCGPEGRAPLVLPEKHVSERNRAFTSLARGEVARVDRLTARGDGLRLDAESRVERVAAADEPVSDD
ncbi:MAG TPA: small ribosomal subunit Rsm22 family protein [Polyangia bacterium]|nr:small ribosomal subunit Rsm22 family protein [Polyangia bacterium]